MNGTLLYEIDVSEIKENMIGPLSRSSSTINIGLAGSTELLMGQVTTVNGQITYQYLTDRRFACPSGGCGFDSAMYNASVLCQSGTGMFTDYRGVQTLVSFACSPDLDTGAALCYI